MVCSRLGGWASRRKLATSSSKTRIRACSDSTKRLLGGLACNGLADETKVRPCVRVNTFACSHRVYTCIRCPCQDTADRRAQRHRTRYLVSAVPRLMKALTRLLRSGTIQGICGIVLALMRLTRHEVQARDTRVARSPLAGVACIAEQAISMLSSQSRHALSRYTANCELAQGAI